ncbi:MAG: hypothetical protein Q9165_006325 [Trypethelium subeluteriae]
MSAPKEVTVVAFFSRLQSITQQQFYAEWDKHGALEIPWLKKHGVINYIQMQTPDNLRNELETALKDAPHKPKMLPFDGCVIMTCESIEKLLGAFRDPYYAEVIAPDEARFVDAQHSHLAASGEVPPAGTAGITSRWLIDGKPTIDISEGEKKLKEVEAKHGK